MMTPQTHARSFLRFARLVCTGALATVGLLALAGCQSSPISGATSGATSVVSSDAAGAYSVTVEPDAGMGFLYTAVSGATSSVQVEMYEMNDTALQSALVAKAKSGVKVSVVLDSAYSGGSVNQSAYGNLKANGVLVKWAPSGTIYHAKFVVIDGKTLFVGTGNFTSQYYATSRDFWVKDTKSGDVSSATKAFAADYAGTSPPPVYASTSLLYSPKSESTILSLINGATHTLYIENEEMDSTYVTSALKAAAKRGVAVYVTMTYSSSWTSALSALSAAGVHVHLYYGETPLYIHAKAICADCTATSGKVFVGSENFSTSSLWYNRELGIVTSARSVVGPVFSTLTADYAGGSGS